MVERPADTQPVRLCQANLGALPKSVLRPEYDRAALTPGIVHIGVGNFHRAHQAWYLHRLMQQGAAQDWAIIGAGVRAYDAEMRRKLLAQDCLTTLVELTEGQRRAEVTGAMIDYLPPKEDNGPLIAQLADPAIRIVSLTVTEGGYFVHPVTKGLDTDHPDIRHDAANPDRPRTAFGAIVAGLRRRRDAGTGPLTGLSCDNLIGNGQVLRQAVVGLARLSDPDLADWIDTQCTFPNSMVDCIVPATGPTELELVRALGIDDAAPVTHESFRQWVIEDAFCAGRPDWDKVGATFTDRVHDYEVMKLRILNAGHQVLANVGEILGLNTIADCMAHPLVSGFFRKVETEEIAPFVRPVPERSVAEYITLIENRFRNPAIIDTTRRVAFDGSSRHVGFVLPSIRDALAAGASVEGLALVEAFWARMCTGTREDGTPIDPNDPFWDDLVAVATQARETPAAWLEQRQYYGDLADFAAFREAFARWLTMIWTQGTTETLKAYLGD